MIVYNCGDEATTLYNLGLARVNSTYPERLFPIQLTNTINAAVFEREVLPLLEKRHFLTEPRRWVPRKADWNDHHTVSLARYVSYKPYEEGVSRWTHFPAFINAVVDHIMHLEGLRQELQDKEQTRERYIRILCRGADKAAIFRKLETTSDPDSIFVGNVLVAAIRVGASTAIEQMLGLFEVDWSLHRRFTESDIWGHPLVAAIQTESVSVVGRVLGIYKSNGKLQESGLIRSCLEAAVRTEQASNVFTILCQGRNSFLLSPHDCDTAIRAALLVGKVDLANMILDFHSADRSDQPSQPSWKARDLLRDSMREACSQGFDGILVRLLDLGMDANHSLHWRLSQNERPVNLACAAGHASTLEILISRGANVDECAGERHDLIEAAVKGGHTGVLRVFIDGGQRLYPSQAHRILDQAAPHPKSAECIWYLLHKGIINVQDLYKGARSRAVPVANIMVSAAIHGNVSFIEALARFGVPIDDRNAPFYEEQDCATPLVAAAAFRQTAMVEALRELGAQEVDWKKSIIARHFYSGVLPCDPPQIEDTRWG